MQDFNKLNTVECNRMAINSNRKAIEHSLNQSQKQNFQKFD